MIGAEQLVNIDIPTLVTGIVAGAGAVGGYMKLTGKRMIQNVNKVEMQALVDNISCINEDGNVSDEELIGFGKAVLMAVVTR